MTDARSTPWSLASFLTAGVAATDVEPRGPSAGDPSPVRTSGSTEAPGDEEPATGPSGPDHAPPGRARRASDRLYVQRHERAQVQDRARHTFRLQNRRGLQAPLDHRAVGDQDARGALAQRPRPADARTLSRELPLLLAPVAAF